METDCRRVQHATDSTIQWKNSVFFDISKRRVYNFHYFYFVDILNVSICVLR